jgi:hypothetical protein
LHSAHLIWHLHCCACRERRAEARQALVRSVHAFPCNWSAWLALAALDGGTEVEADASLPRHWARDFYLVHVCLEAQENDEALGRLQVAPRPFAPHFIISCRAPRFWVVPCVMHQW